MLTRICWCKARVRFRRRDPRVGGRPSRRRPRGADPRAAWWPPTACIPQWTPRPAVPLRRPPSTRSPIGRVAAKSSAARHGSTGRRGSYSDGSVRHRQYVIAGAATAWRRKANQAKDELLAKLAHELRNPLSSVKGWTELARKKASIAQWDIRRTLDVINSNTEVQQHLIEDLLDLPDRVGVRACKDSHVTPRLGAAAGG
ncbi:sensor histidine kinase [Aquincola tertiaricarbonis]|uniref:sensor histidine kinase n=1 Tax=Aquincola tertiaricarbonis TaxID=391953 RepID=UPI002873E72B|nr:histidine kinase dimerization/phospho-acceptor domain-containing protein [Aquincola tertiaricarbonis]